MQLPLIVFSLVLAIAATAAVAACIAMGFRQWRRRSRLAHKANRLALRFAVEDPFDIPSRHARMMLLRAGHSLCAHNVTHGHLAGWPLQAFDLSCEAGHGTARLTRRYSVTVVELPREVGSLLLWPDAEPWALAVDADGRVGRQNYVGSQGLAAAAAEKCHSLGQEEMRLQVRGSTLMLGLPRNRSSESYFDMIESARSIGQTLLSACPCAQEPADARGQA